jgi:hypothetical protein
LLVPPANPFELAEALGMLLTDRVARAMLMARSRRNCERFNVQRVSDDYLSVYERALASRQPRRFANVATAGLATPEIAVPDAISQKTTW